MYENRTRGAGCCKVYPQISVLGEMIESGIPDLYTRRIQERS